MTYTTKQLIEAELRATTPFSGSTYPSNTQVDAWITETDSYINKIAGRTFSSSQYTEVIDYNGEETIHLEHSPVISVDTFNYATKSLGDTDYPTWAAKTEDTHFTTYNDKGEIEMLFNNFSPLSGKKRLQIIYTAGYSTVPSYVQMIATKMVAKRVIDSVLQKDTNEKQSGKSISVGSISIVKPADFGVNQYGALTNDIESLKKELLKSNLVYRYN